VGVWVGGCVYKIEKFKTLSAPSEIANNFLLRCARKNKKNNKKILFVHQIKVFESHDGQNKSVL
jgi:hypothetical protein